MRTAHGSAAPSLMAVRAFEAAARQGSFTAGGAEIGLTQSAVSRHVRLLEDLFGVRLFERLGRRVALTAPGEAYYSQIATAFASIQAANRMMLGRKQDNSVVVGVLPSVAALWLAPRLGEFVASHPTVDLTLRASRAVIDPATEGVDVCLRYGAGGWPDVNGRLFCRETLTPVCSPEFARRRGLDGGDVGSLMKAPLLEDDLIDGWDRWFEAAGGRGVPVPPRARLDDSASLYQVAADGGGVALGRSLLVEGMIAAGKLVAPFPVAIESTYAYWIVTPRGLQPRLATRQFVRWIEQLRPAGRLT